MYDLDLDLGLCGNLLFLLNTKLWFYRGVFSQLLEYFTSSLCSSWSISQFLVLLDLLVKLELLLHAHMLSKVQGFHEKARCTAPSSCSYAHQGLELSWKSSLQSFFFMLIRSPRLRVQGFMEKHIAELPFFMLIMLSKSQPSWKISMQSFFLHAHMLSKAQGLGFHGKAHCRASLLHTRNDFQVIAFLKELNEELLLLHARTLSKSQLFMEKLTAFMLV